MENSKISETAPTFGMEKLVREKKNEGAKDRPYISSYMGNVSEPLENSSSLVEFQNY